MGPEGEASADVLGRAEDASDGRAPDAPGDAARDALGLAVPAGPPLQAAIRGISRSADRSRGIGCGDG